MQLRVSQQATSSLPAVVQTPGACTAFFENAQRVYLCEERGQLHASSSDALLLLLHMSEAGIPDVTSVRLFQFVSYSFLHLKPTSYGEQHLMT